MAMPKSELEHADPKVFSNATALSNSEVLTMLNEYIRQRKTDTNFQPPAVVQKTQEYTEKFNCGKNAEAVSSLRGILEQAGLRGFEWALLANLAPETSDEAVKLVPSLAEEHNDPSDGEPRQLAPEDIDMLLGQVHDYRNIA